MFCLLFIFGEPPDSTYGGREFSNVAPSEDAVSVKNVMNVCMWLVQSTHKQNSNSRTVGHCIGKGSEMPLELLSIYATAKCGIYYNRLPVCLYTLVARQRPTFGLFLCIRKFLNIRKRRAIYLGQRNFLVLTVT